jgi:membrane protein CcdC involved in cytochrome C biogenesis
MDEANAFLSGATVLACMGIALFFVRFWRSSGDRLFAIFALAFTVFAANRLILVLLSDENENTTYVYLVRLVAFVLIILAILDKNRRDLQSRFVD